MSNAKNNVLNLTDIRDWESFSSQSIANKLKETVSVKDYGALLDGVTDESLLIQDLITSHNYIYVPYGFTLICKNIELNNNSQIIIDGTVKLPNACSDFDRMFFADSKTGINFKINEIDGNSSGQSGDIGTHLIYLTNCSKCNIDVTYLHNHYISANATMPSLDGYRNTSSGPIFVYNGTQVKCHAGRITGWGREAIYFLDCTMCEVSCSYALATGLTEYSGVQVSGTLNHILHAIVENAGGSAVGFDTQYGSVSNVVTKNTRANHGFNMGHPGRPATGSVANNICVDGCYANGINIQSSSADVSVSNFIVRNAGNFGLNTSDGSTNSKFTNGTVEYASKGNINVLTTDTFCVNVKSDTFDSLTVTGPYASFQDNETITTSTGSAQIRAQISNLSATEKIYFLTNYAGTISAAQTMTGASSGASIVIASVATPKQYSELSGGHVAETSRYTTGSNGSQVRLLDGTAIFFHSTALSLTAGVLASQDITYFSNVVWASAPKITASINSASSTAGYTLQTLQVSSTTSSINIKAKADVTQTYGVSIIAVGRWK